MKYLKENIYSELSSEATPLITSYNKWRLEYRTEVEKIKSKLTEINKKLLNEIEVYLVDLDEYKSYLDNFIDGDGDGDYDPLSSLMARYSYKFDYNVISIFDAAIDKLDLEIGSESYGVYWVKTKKGRRMGEGLPNRESIEKVENKDEYFFSVTFEFKGVQ